LFECCTKFFEFLLVSTLPGRRGAVTSVMVACWGFILLGHGFFFLFFSGEFDPGSGRTLAACLTHASRTLKLGACTWWMSGERVSNT
jgi:hypothetical protein